MDARTEFVDEADFVADESSFMSAVAVIGASAIIETCFAAGVAIAACYLLFRMVWKGTAPRGRVADLERALTPGREAACVIAIVLSAFLFRFIGWNRLVTAPFVFSQWFPLFVADMIGRGTWWSDWLALLKTYQGQMTHQSAVMMLLAAGFQAVFGPLLNLPTLMGAFVGTAAVVLAWLVGRAVRSRSFGLAFAAFVAMSPLQIVWSRIGGLPIGCVPHMLLVIWLAYLAAARASPFVAGLAAFAMWATLYHYYPARVALPVGAVAFAIGACRHGIRKAAVPLLMLLVTLGTIYGLAGRPGIRETVWPNYTGYVGNTGKTGLGDFGREALDSARRLSSAALRAYFVENRQEKPVVAPAPSKRGGSRAIVPGMEWGGLCFLPVAVLGGIGAIVSLRRLRGLIWILLAVIGFAVPVLSAVTARRFLAFDVAWCALAGEGLLAMLESPLARTLSARAAATGAAAFLAVMATWSFTAIVALNGVLPGEYGVAIPFGESGFGDGHTCLSCFRVAYRWQEDIAHGDFIVLFDTDIMRENRTTPGGMDVYGKLAALAAGRPDDFLEFYSVMANWDMEPPRGGAYFDAKTTDFVSFLQHRIERAQPQRIVWDFEQPTAWENWLAERLEAAGGVRETLPGPTPIARASWVSLNPQEDVEEAPLPDTRPFRIVMPWNARAAAFTLLRRFSTKGTSNACLHVDGLAADDVGGPGLLLAPMPGEDGRPAWAVVNDTGVHLGEKIFPIKPVGIEYVPAQDSFHMIDRIGSYYITDSSLRRRSLSLFALAQPLGNGCAAFVAGGWWTVDPLAGRATPPPDRAVTLPAGRWVGIAAGPHDELVLASADQQIVTFDASRGVETGRFPATVWPARRLTFPECSIIAVGDRWIASFGQRLGTVAVYNRDGQVLGTIALEPPMSFFTIRGAGAYLGVGSDTKVKSLRLTPSADCYGTPGVAR